MTAPPMQVSDERLAELVARGVDRIQDDQIILDSGYEGGGYLTERADLQEQHDARKDVVAALRELLAARAMTITTEQSPAEDNQWVPVTERLPASSGVYLVTVGYRDETVVEMREFRGSRARWRVSNVTAWRYTPAPYAMECKPGPGGGA
jgi:hypothetical protein